MAESGVVSPRNPLKDRKILNRIYPLLDIADLKNFRLVCREWFEASLEHWRATVPLRILWVDAENEEETKFRAEAMKNVMKTLAQVASSRLNFNQSVQFLSTARLFDEDPELIFHVMELNNNLMLSPRGIGIYEFFKLNTCAKDDEDPLPLLRLKTTPYKRYKLVGWNWFGREFWQACVTCLPTGEVELIDLCLRIQNDFHIIRLPEGVEQFEPNYWFEHSFAPQAVESLEFHDCNLKINRQFLPPLYNLKELKKLILSGATFDDLPPATGIRNDNKLLNLHTLELNYLDPDFLGSNMLPLDMPWSALFNATPNLRKFVMKYKTVHGSIEILKRILEAIRDIRKRNKGSTLNLQVFDIKDAFVKEEGDEGESCESTGFPIPVIVLLVATDFPLKNLQLDIGSFMDERGLIPRLIRTFKRTLEVLFVRRYPVPPFPSTSDVYPFDGDCVMESLKVLQLEGPFSQNCMFLKLLPKLEIFQNRILSPSQAGNSQPDGSVVRLVKIDIQEGVKELEKLTGMKYSVNKFDNGKTAIVKKCNSKQDWVRLIPIKDNDFNETLNSSDSQIATLKLK